MNPLTSAAALLAALTILATTLPCRAAETATQQTAHSEAAVLAGYGITHSGFGATRTQVQTFDTILRYGRFLSGEIGRGAWYQGRHELFMELPLHLVVDPRDRIMTGAYLLGSWKFTSMSSEGLYPYAFAGGGILYNDLGLATQGTRLNFSYQGGIGLQKMLVPDTALTAECRYHHVSNAGTAEPNEPLNSSKFLIGISKLF